MIQAKNILAVAFAFAIMFFATCNSAFCSADKATLSVTKSDTQLSDALAELSRSSGVPIVTDSSVIDTVGLTTIKDASIDTILATVANETPGLTWTKLYLSKNAKISDADALSSQVRLIQSLAGVDYVVVNAAKNMQTSVKQTPLTATAADQAPDGMQMVYLVTNEKVRAQQVADSKAEDAKKDAPVVQAPKQAALSSIQNFSNALAQMSPQDQVAVLPQMMQQMFQAMSNLSPEAREQLREQMRQSRGGFGGGTGGRSVTGQ